MDYCDLCGFEHFDWHIYVRWLEMFSYTPTGRDRLNSETLAGAQLRRYAKIVHNHREGKRVWEPEEVFERISRKRRTKSSTAKQRPSSHFTWEKKLATWEMSSSTQTDDTG